MTTRITILGAGPGGYIAAVRAAQMGAEVTVIEEENVGGTCLNRGCIPSKVLITTAELLEKFQRAEAFGIDINGDIRLNLQRLMARKNTVIQNQVNGIRSLFKHHRINYINGRGYLKAPHMATVKQNDGGEREISWDKLILATGSRPLNIPGFSFNGDSILSSNHALDIQEIPESVMIAGGGVIGCEFAFILRALGAEVSVVEMMSRLLPLPSVDEACSKVLQREMKKKKINFMLSSKVDTVVKEIGKLQVTILPVPSQGNPPEKAQTPQVIEVEKMLVCIGRKPNTENTGIENLGVQTDAGGWVIANERMETATEGVYAIGDLLGPSKVMLAHVASAEGQVAAENAMGADRTMNYDVVPGAIFTMPEVANVGLTETEARKQNDNVRADSVLFRAIGKAHVSGEIAGEAKIVWDADNGKILGVHIIGPHATDLIAEASLAIQTGSSVADMAATIHAHPTLAEIMGEVSHKAMGKALHG